MRLLIVDDHAQYRAMAVRLLQVLGHEVVEAHDEASATAAMAREGAAFEVVMLDLFLGDSDGATVAGHLEASHPGVRILFMSGHDKATVESALSAGKRRGFIEKPFALPVLEASLAALVAMP